MGFETNNARNSRGTGQGSIPDWSKIGTANVPKPSTPATPLEPTMPSFQRPVAQPAIPRWDSVAAPTIPAPSAPPRPIARPIAPPISTPVKPMPSVPAQPVASSGVAEPVPTVSIQVSLPAFGIPTPLKTAAKQGTRAASQAFLRAGRSIRRLSPRRASQAIAVLVVAGSVATGGYYLVVHKHSPATADAAGATASTKTAMPTLTSPTFRPVAPKSEPNLATGKSGITRYDGTHDSYSYQDVFKGHSLLVSQQKVPSKFKSADEAVSSIAAQIKATQPIKTNQGTAYMATDAKSNQQTIVAVVDNVLIFIQSPFSNGASEWQTYINDLVQP